MSALSHQRKLHLATIVRYRVDSSPITSSPRSDSLSHRGFTPLFFVATLASCPTPNQKVGRPPKTVPSLRRRRGVGSASMTSSHTRSPSTCSAISARRASCARKRTASLATPKRATPPRSATPRAASSRRLESGERAPVQHNGVALAPLGKAQPPDSPKLRMRSNRPGARRPPPSKHRQRPAARFAHTRLTVRALSLRTKRPMDEIA